ncbi:MAG TPA: cytochrome c family protein [Sphingorhabdus sp.]|jgi:cytochrome c|uniref:c-type cytochrome n=1 Tax=Sphingorhabdus sp. TaxID=1902408 RepID=UPI002C707674|nr:cytochrome c family protein [Sphingorhabdus sp.]HMT40359.1 cytochrome c family protein [Sphingorhabdus sp.]HMU21229.1 cytochrome c family protein [Sphingorhabdus sp.]
MRKLVIFTPALLALAACGGTEQSEAPAPEAETATDAVEAAPAATAEISGEKSFAKCTACHKVEKGAPNGVGPNLHGIVGKAVASTEGFAYSTAMKAKGGNWDEATLDAYLENPRKVVPGTKMAFAGINNAEERTALIAWLKEQK